MGKLTLIGFTLLFTSSVVGQSLDYLLLNKNADSCYRAQEYQCAISLFRKGLSFPESRRSDLYYLSVSYAKVSAVDSALFFLEMAATRGIRYTSLDAAQNEPNLSSLKKSPGSESIFERIVQNTLEYGRILYPGVAEKLVGLKSKDQRYRRAVSLGASNDWESQRKLDLHNQEQLRDIIEVIGWPTIRKVGNEANKVAWLIAQHADNDVEFQQQCLEMIIGAFRSYDTNASQVAYLTDRVLINLGKSQKFGTQLIIKRDSAGNASSVGVKSLEDFRGLDLRRKYYGLPSLEEYKNLFLKNYSD